MATREVMTRQIRRKRGDFGPKRTRIPDFDRLVVTSGHNLAPIRRELHGGDVTAVGVSLLGLQFECGCVGKQRQSVKGQT